jgi:hypothetical protein
MQAFPRDQAHLQDIDLEEKCLLYLGQAHHPVRLQVVRLRLQRQLYHRQVLLGSNNDINIMSG